MGLEARLAAGTLTALAMLSVARPAFGQEDIPDQTAITQEVNPDDLIRSQLHVARAGDEFPLNNLQVGWLVRLPWIGGEFDLALLTADDSFLGVGIQTDCAFRALAASNQLHSTRFYGISNPDHRFPQVDVKVEVPELFPVIPVVEFLKLSPDPDDPENIQDCMETSAEEDTVKFAKKVARYIPPAAEKGARGAKTIFEAVTRGFLEKDDDTP